MFHPKALSTILVLVTSALALTSCANIPSETLTTRTTQTTNETPKLSIEASNLEQHQTTTSPSTIWSELVASDLPKAITVGILADTTTKQTNLIAPAYIQSSSQAPTQTRAPTTPTPVTPTSAQAQSSTSTPLLEPVSTSVSAPQLVSLAPIVESKPSSASVVIAKPTTTLPSLKSVDSHQHNAIKVDDIQPSSSLSNTTTFSCFGRPTGYYADVKLKCILYHFCSQIEAVTGVTQYQRMTYACLDDSVFDQKDLNCVMERDLRVPCNLAEKEYEISNKQFDPSEDSTPSMGESVAANLMMNPLTRFLTG